MVRDPIDGVISHIMQKGGLEAWRSEATWHEVFTIAGIAMLLNDAKRAAIEKAIQQAEPTSEPELHHDAEREKQRAAWRAAKAKARLNKLHGRPGRKPGFKMTPEHARQLAVARANRWKKK